MSGAGGPFPLGRSARLAVFASGRGTNLSSLLAAYPPRSAAAGQGRATTAPRRRSAAAPGQGRGAALLASIELVISNKPDAPALARAAAAGVRAEYLEWRSREQFDDDAARLLEAEAIDLICLAGFMRLFTAAFTRRFAGRILNIHPSLLPDFPGLHPHRQALRAGATQSGCSVHFVDAGVDSGRVVLQRRVPVLSGDTEASLADRILAEEHIAYPEAVRMVLEGSS